MTKLALSAASFAAMLGFATAVPALALPSTIRDLGVASPTRSIDFTVKLPLRNRAELETLTRLQGTPGSPIYHHFLMVDQFRARYAPTADTIARARAALIAQGFTVSAVHSQSLEVTGSTAAIERAFNVPVHLMQSAHGGVAARAMGALHPQPAIAALGATIVGLTHVMERRSHARMSALQPKNRDSTLGDYWFDDLKQAYTYPSYATVNGKGVTIATVGGSDFSGPDITAYFQHELIGAKSGDLAPSPTFVHKALKGGTAFNANSGDSFEADLDVEQAAGSAPGATIVGIATDDSTDAGFIDAYQDIVDKVSGFAAQVVSTSYGECELAYTTAYAGSDQTSILTSGYHDVFLQGNSEGITFTVSSGDNAGLDCPQAGYFTNTAGGGKYSDTKGVETSADDPNVVAVGGTNLLTTYTSGSLNSAYVSENAYHDTIGQDDPYGTGNYVVNEMWGSGGGASQIFAKPAWQNDITTGVSTRAVPDVAMQMGGCPSGATSCYSQTSAAVEIFNGEEVGVVGTSASSPEFAGLLALRIQATGEMLGNANPVIYNAAASNPKIAHKYFHEGIPGNNGVVAVAAGTVGYNVITGVGSLFGANFIDEASAPLAGIPQTASNP